MIEFIKKGLVYVDEFLLEEMCEYCGILIEVGKNSLYCDCFVEENLILFEKMKNGEFEEGKVSLCVKIDMVLLFMVMCDFVLYCIKFVSYY